MAWFEDAMKVGSPLYALLNQSGGNSNPFSSFQFDRGAGIDPFSQLRAGLGTRLFNNAGVFGDQGQAFLNSRGMFDPNLAESIRGRAFSGAQTSLAQALAQLASQEGQFREGQRQFNIGMDFTRLQNQEDWNAAQPSIFDWISGGGQAAAGLAQLLPFLL